MAWSKKAREAASERSKKMWEDKRKMETMQAPNVIVNPTPAPPEVAKAEAEQAAYEADPRNRTRPGQDQFDQAMEDQHRHDRAENLAYGLPEKVADYEGVMANLPFDPSTVGQMFGQTWDVSVVTPQMMKDYGINPETHVPVWDYMDNYGNRGVDYEQEHLNNNPWDRVARYRGADTSKHGKKLTRDGYVLFARPREVQNWINKRFDDINVDLIENAPKGNPPLDNEADVAAARATTMKSIEEYMKGSPTANMGSNNLDAAMDRIPKERAQREWEMTLRSIAPNRFDEAKRLSAENARDRTAEQLKASVGNRSTHAMGAGFDADGKVVR